MFKKYVFYITENTLFLHTPSKTIFGETFLIIFFQTFFRTVENLPAINMKAGSAPETFARIYKATGCHVRRQQFLQAQQQAAAMLSQLRPCFAKNIYKSNSTCFILGLLPSSRLTEQISLAHVLRTADLELTETLSWHAKAYRIPEEHKVFETAFALLGTAKGNIRRSTEKMYIYTHTHTHICIYIVPALHNKRLQCYKN